MARYFGLKELSPGIRGRTYTYDKGSTIILSDVVVQTNLRGKGYFSKYLSKLEDDYETIIIPNVISKRLESILRRRGYSSPRSSVWVKSSGKTFSFDLFEVGLENEARFKQIRYAIKHKDEIEERLARLKELDAPKAIIEQLENQLELAREYGK